MNRSAVRALIGVAAVILAIALQTTVCSRLPLPGGAPSLPLVLVVAGGLAGGAPVGAGLGFGTGLLADALGSHPLGVQALVFLLVGVAVGSIDAQSERSVFWSVVVVAVTAVASYLLYSVLLTLVGSPVAWGEQLRDLPAAVGYDILLTPLVLPLVLLVNRSLAAPGTRLHSRADGSVSRVR